MRTIVERGLSTVEAATLLDIRQSTIHNRPRMLSVLFTADLPEGSIRAKWVESTRLIIPEVEAAVERSWNEKLKVPNIKLWDGPMCRLEKWSLVGDSLELELSPTSYKTFFGTNMSNPQLLKKYGRGVGANPVGVSPALETSDGYLMLGRRNATVAYYPNRLHPFAGALEPTESDDILKAIRRELKEELSFDASDIDRISLIGMVEDEILQQPEPIFHVRSTRTRDEIAKRVATDEHQDSWSVKAMSAELDAAFEETSLFTPVAIAALLLFGRIRFDDGWFDRALKQINSCK